MGRKDVIKAWIQLLSLRHPFVRQKRIPCYPWNGSFSCSANSWMAWRPSSSSPTLVYIALVMDFKENHRESCAHIDWGPSPRWSTCITLLTPDLPSSHVQDPLNHCMLSSRMCFLSACPGRTLLRDVSSLQSNLWIHKREKCYPFSWAVLLVLFFDNYKFQEIPLFFLSTH